MAEIRRSRLDDFMSEMRQFRTETNEDLKALNEKVETANGRTGDLEKGLGLLQQKVELTAELKVTESRTSAIYEGEKKDSQLWPVVRNARALPAGLWVFLTVALIFAFAQGDMTKIAENLGKEYIAHRYGSASSEPGQKAATAPKPKP